jgi:hypothetical protein
LCGNSFVFFCRISRITYTYEHLACGVSKQPA